VLGEIEPDRGDLHLYGSPLEWLSDGHPTAKAIGSGGRPPHQRPVP
jgi:hypothetical protein